MSALSVSEFGMRYLIKGIQGLAPQLSAWVRKKLNDEGLRTGTHDLTLSAITLDSIVKECIVLT